MRGVSLLRPAIDVGGNCIITWSQLARQTTSRHPAIIPAVCRPQAALGRGGGAGGRLEKISKFWRHSHYTIHIIHYQHGGITNIGHGNLHGYLEATTEIKDPRSGVVDNQAACLAIIVFCTIAPRAVLAAAPVWVQGSPGSRQHKPPAQSAPAHTGQCGAVSIAVFRSVIATQYVCTEIRWN